MPDIYTADRERAMSELATWISKGHSPFNQITLLTVATGFEVAVIDYALNGHHWLLGEDTAPTRADALYQLGAALDELSARQQATQNQATDKR